MAERKPYIEYGKRVAVVGASSNKNRFSNKAVQAFVQEGFKVFPVHPSEAEVLELTAYQSVDAIPGDIHIVSVYIKPSNQANLLEQLRSKSPLLVIFNPGTENPELEKQVREFSEVRDECSIIGLGRSPGQFSD